MQVHLPVPRYPAGRPGYRLVGWMMLGRGQCRAAGEHPVLRVTPEPVFARLEAPDERVPGRGRVLGGVLGRRGVAAADVPALRAAAQMQPPPAAGVALDASGPAGRN